MREKGDRVVEIVRAHLASLADAWKYARVARLDVAVNPRLRSTLARWIPPSNVIEISAAAKARGARALQEILAHEAAHVVVWDQSGQAAQPHGPEWAAVMRAAGFEPRATLIRCGHRRGGGSDTVRIRHFCPVCHFSNFGKRRMRRWRCPECRTIGLEGNLKTEPVSDR
jgi:predicted SprT family Zn-dependent metalloprotease